MYNITQLRESEFPASANQTYLNHAAISPLPQRSAARVRFAIDGLTQDPISFWMNVALATSQQLCADVATLINAVSPGEIVPVTNTGDALSAIARALPLNSGDNIIFVETEFPSNAYPWMALEKKGIEARSVPAVSGGLTLETVERFADGRTRAVAVSSIQFLSGHRTDLKAIGAYCRDHDIIFIVDAIQSLGHMRFDVREMNIDILASGGQKSLMALPGIGVLYVRDELCERLAPWPIASNATVNFLHWLDYDQTPLPGAARFANGTPNLPGIFGMQSSIGLIQELGPELIDAHTSSLTRYGHQAVSDLGYEVITPIDSLGPILTFRSGLDVDSTDALVAKLAREHILVAKHLDAPGNAYIRVSVHCYNTMADIDSLVDLLPGP